MVLQAWFARINSRQSLTIPTTCDHNDEKIDEISCEILALVLQFANLLQRKISKIFQNRFRLLSLYKLQHPKGRDNIAQDQIAIKDNTLQIQKLQNPIEIIETTKLFLC